MRRLIAIVGVLALLGAAAVFAGAQDDEAKSGTEYKIIFDNAFGLTKGGDFRVGGVKAGSTPTFKAITPKGGPPKAEVTAKITEPGFGDFREDASCNIKPQSLIGEYYVDCQPGSPSKPRLKKGGTVPVGQTSSTIPQDLVNNILRRPYKERLRLVINELGTGLAGRPEDLAAVLRRAHPGLRETSATLRILGNQNRTIENFIRDSDTVVSALEARKQEVTRWIDEAGDTAEITATRRNELASTFNKLPGFLDELDPTMKRLGQLTDEQIPLLADAQRAAPSLDTFLTRLGPFAQASRPAIRSLGNASEKGTRAFKRGSEEVAELKRLGAQAAPTAKPLAQFLDSLDDRRRAIDTDPRGKVGAPPAGDASNRGRGQQRRLHRPGVALDLLLLAEPVAERVRQHRPRAAAGRHGQRLQPAGEPHAAEQPRAEAQVRQVQRLARAQPAGQHHAGLHPHRQRAGRRQEQEGRRLRRRARDQGRRAPLRRPARRRPRGRPARPVQAADRPAPGRAGAGRRPDQEHPARADQGPGEHRQGGPAPQR